MGFFVLSQCGKFHQKTVAARGILKRIRRHSIFQFPDLIFHDLRLSQMQQPADGHIQGNHDPFQIFSAHDHRQFPQFISIMAAELDRRSGWNDIQGPGTGDPDLLFRPDRETALAQMYKRLVRPVGFVIIERVLAGLAVESHQALAVLPEQRLGDAPSEAEIAAALSKEADAIEEKLPRTGSVIALCIEGRELSSVQLSEAMARYADVSVSDDPDSLI